ncbi:MAG: TonB family protein [Bacteroidetes bacterium OLB12]|nr:MAG: TonB family protein [Bacteroidetes bacterium OLB12]
MATAISMLATYFVVVACQDQLESVKEVTDNSTMALSYPLEVQAELEKARQGNPGTEFYVLEMNEAGKKKMEEVIKELQINSLEGRPVIVKEGSEVRNFFIYKKTGQVSVINSLTVSEDGVHTVVEQSAEPKGGMTEFYKYIATTLKYPAEARKKGVEGRVFIEFVINEDGSISNARPLKGIGAGCDEEALRVVANSPAWTPAMQDGKIVKQRIVLPIVFRLDNPKNEGDNTNP